MRGDYAYAQFQVFAHHCVQAFKLAQLDHDNVVQLYEQFIHTSRWAAVKFKPPHKFCMVMELCTKGVAPVPDKDSWDLKNLRLSTPPPNKSRLLKQPLLFHTVMFSCRCNLPGERFASHVCPPPHC